MGTPLGKGWTILSMEKFSPISNLSLAWCSSRLFPLVLSLFPGSRARPFSSCKETERSPLSLFLSRLNKSNGFEQPEWHHLEGNSWMLFQQQFPSQQGLLSPKCSQHLLRSGLPALLRSRIMDPGSRSALGMLSVTQGTPQRLQQEECLCQCLGKALGIREHKCFGCSTIWTRAAR